MRRKRLKSPSKALKYRLEVKLSRGRCFDFPFFARACIQIESRDSSRQEPRVKNIFCKSLFRQRSTQKINLANSRDRQSPFAIPPTLPNSPHPQLILRSVTSGTSRDFGNFSRLREKRRRRLKFGFYFFTYECCRRRLSLIKMIHGVEEALILLLTAFRYEYLF